MINDPNKPFVDANLPWPEFTPEYLEAFLCLCLAKLGGKQTIPLELLKNYPVGSIEKPVWDEATQTYTMKIAEAEMPIIKIASKMPKLSRN